MSSRADEVSPEILSGQEYPLLWDSSAAACGLRPE